MARKNQKNWAKQKAEFFQGLDAGGLSDVFERESRRTQSADEHEAALRRKACERKNRYSSRFDAECAIEACAEHGTQGLRCYKCRFCNGWHLTSKPQENDEGPAVEAGR